MLHSNLTPEYASLLYHKLFLIAFSLVYSALLFRKPRNPCLVKEGSHWTCWVHHIAAEGRAKQIKGEVYVVKNLSMPLLGLPDIKALGLLVCVDSIDMDTLRSSYPKQCRGLGEIQRPYAIKLKPGAAGEQELSTGCRLCIKICGHCSTDSHKIIRCNSSS